MYICIRIQNKENMNALRRIAEQVVEGMDNGHQFETVVETLREVTDCEFTDREISDECAVLIGLV